ncbi:MAG: hypothetical protein KO202_02665 [Methanobacteriaceae archaeon]|jgi:hypothetical protein|nr:hypothetical protein [Methanobacteriaceae archaeon]
MEYINNNNPRILETIIGLVGGIIGLIASSFILFLGSFGSTFTVTLAILAIIGSFLGIFAAFYVRTNNVLAGIMFIIAAILVIIGATILGIPAMLLLLLAGFLSLFRN